MIKIFNIQLSHSLNVDNIIEVIVSLSNLWLVNELDTCMAHTGIQSVKILYKNCLILI